MGGICKNVYSDIYDCVNNKFFSKYKIVICWKLVVNYIEVELDIIVIYLIIGKVFYDKIYKIENLFDFITGKIENTLVMNNIIEFVNIGIKFFFLTVVLSYFSSHMRTRKFRDN